MTQLQEFILVFGQRFVGLVDNAGVYSVYRVPYPEAPYPQDYIIDQQGNVAYWSDQYDPQEIIRVIDSLLGTKVEEHEVQEPGTNRLELNILPNPTRDMITVKFQTISSKNQAEIKIYDLNGRLIRNFSVLSSYFLVPGEIMWDLNDQVGDRVPAGIYHIRLLDGENSVTKSCVVTQ
jgi:hypothetical protein